MTPPSYPRQQDALLLHMPAFPHLSVHLEIQHSVVFILLSSHHRGPSSAISAMLLFFPSSRFRFRRTLPNSSHYPPPPRPPVPLPLAFLSRTSPLRSPNLNLKGGKAGAVTFNGPVIDAKELEDEKCELVMETCLTRTLPPAVTMEGGIESIKRALEELKLNPPPHSSGVFRFQVAVPPSPKALQWFCCQPESSGVFPRFFLSKETENPTFKSLDPNTTRGVFGIGVAIEFMQSSSRRTSGEQSLMRRYLSSDSIHVNMYGLLGVKYDKESSSITHEAGSVYFFIPKVELEEHDDATILAATLAWDSTLFCTFEQAIESCKSTIYQCSSYFFPMGSCIQSIFRKVNMVEHKGLQMVSATATLLDRRSDQGEPLELSGMAFYGQFCFRLSATVGIFSNVLDTASEIVYSLQEFPNINAVWASLIVEECSRLGLKYFCIAPGSRSSPLAIAASTHPLTTCVACYDERSLAFHAVGYGRGSRKPAIVITSSGTAVSNLLPAVVEASQDFVPLLLLTADRPPELQDAGANQAINQVNHFGSFVRFFFSLPPPTDDIPARMVITTVDSAVHWATTSPYGPVHINCPFREPLDDSPNRWDLSCLKGLDIWTTSAKPFTRYIAIQSSFSLSGDLPISLSEIIGIIEGARRGLLLFGAIHTEDDMWAALLLAKHLNWPVVADILSDLRLRKLLASVPETEDNVLFIDHLDHALLSDSVRDWINFDVIIQIGSRITSKRISQMLEQCYPCSYVVVDNHPWRYDPSHFITHRIQCSIVQFSDSLVKARFPCGSSKWCGYLQVLEKMVAWVVSFQILAENSLTEPHVAHVISGALCADSAIFLGNSMVIRDVDMYGSSCKSPHSIVDMVLNSELPCLGIRVAGNRGTSGIDGLLSTAIGFATGCSKRVLCVMGDVSFLHDTNGLALLNQRLLRKPMTILVINNHGGAIFSLLPIADRTDPRLLNQYFYTSHNISIRELCKAHGVNHLQVKTKVELQDALLTSRNGKMDYVIEVESCINANSAFHSMLRKSACQAADHTLRNLFELSVPDSIPERFFLSKIRKMEYSLYRIQLCAPPTSGFDDANELHREGYILSLSLEDGIVGYGEVAPLRIHKENMKDIDEQLRFLFHVIRGKKVCFSLSLLNGSFTSWIWKQLGILESSIFPSVRCGLEMAILSAIAQRRGSSFLGTQQMRMGEEDVNERTSSVKICALVDSDGSPATVACIASSLVEEGFTAIKLKVARQANPAEDAAIIQEVRKKVGMQIELRVDANRHWTYEEAVQFGSLVKDCDLQYIEEPVQDEDDIIRFCEESGLPVALDETIDSFRGNFLHMLGKYAHPGIVALVIKPSVVGGFEKAALIARWAQQLGKMAVVSAAFESGLGLSSYILLSYFLDLQNADLCRAMNRELGRSVAHGLGTYQWLKEDVMTKPLGIRRDICTGFIGASVADAIQVLHNFEVNQSVIHRTFSGEQVCQYSMTLQLQNISYIISVLEVGPKDTDNVVVFLHGFLGTGEDWLPIMKALSGSARCISFDFPGHGRSKIQNCGGGEDNHDLSLSVDVAADVFNKLIQKITPGQVTVVGYSMGARIALHMALRLSEKINGAVLISGSPGIKDSIARKIRKAKDDSRASFLVRYGLECFLGAWYTGELWRSLRSHPHFKEVVASRMLHDDVDSLARALSDLSIGRQSPLWEDLKQCNLPLMLIVGGKDQKFQAIARQMYCEIEGVGNESHVDTRTFEVVEVANCGHAVHLEDPLSVISVLSRFLTQLQEASRPG